MILSKLSENETERKKFTSPTDYALRNLTRHTPTSRIYVQRPVHKFEVTTEYEFVTHRT